MEKQETSSYPLPSVMAFFLGKQPPYLPSIVQHTIISRKTEVKRNSYMSLEDQGQGRQISIIKLLSPLQTIVTITKEKLVGCHTLPLALSGTAKTYGMVV